MKNHEFIKTEQKQDREEGVKPYSRDCFARIPNILYRRRGYTIISCGKPEILYNTVKTVSGLERLILISSQF